MNSLFAIRPYKTDGVWAFDDASVGLLREPFVLGMGEIIDELVAQVLDADDGVTIVFSAQPFPRCALKLTRQEAEHGGTWYLADTGRRGWLCPALFLYFATAPETLYVALAD